MSLTISAVVPDSTYNDSGKSGKTIYAGNLNIGNTESSVAQKREQAQKQAMKLISDAWDKDNKSSQNISDMKESKADKIADLKEIRTKIEDIENQKSTVQEEYGVDPDSQEQKDLELLEKFQNYKGGAENLSFSQDEISRLKELQDVPRTDYQNEVLSLNAVSGDLSNQEYKKNLEIQGLAQSINGAKTDQDKSQNMTDAQDAAKEVIGSANDEILGMLLQEGVDHIDDNMEENKEKAEESEEKKEEQQDRIDSAKEKREDQEEILEGDAEADKIELNAELDQKSNDNVEQAQKNIQKMIKDNNLVDEDLKGIKIDFNF